MCIASQGTKKYNLVSHWLSVRHFIFWTHVLITNVPKEIEIKCKVAKYKVTSLDFQYPNMKQTLQDEHRGWIGNVVATQNLI